MRSHHVARTLTLSALAIAPALLLGLALGRAAPADAAGGTVITNCSESGVTTAMITPGLITFNCGGTHAPAAITLTQAGGLTINPGAYYTFDGTNGGNTVVLSGGGANRLFNVQSGGALTFTNIVLSDGFAGSPGSLGTQGGALLNNGGRLRLDFATVRNSHSLFAGGAIENAAGTTILQDSLVENNRSDYGGGIDSAGTLLLSNSTIRFNQAITHSGGGLDVGGTVIISDSLILGNTLLKPFMKGAGINVVNGGTVLITGSRLDSNGQLFLTTVGGAIYNGGMLTLTQSTLNGNLATYGGAIENAGVMSIWQSTLSGNSATNNGGGIDNADTLVLGASSLSANGASVEGGGFFNNGYATVINSVFNRNTAASGAGISNEYVLTVTTSTLSGNQATSAGGGLYNGDTARVFTTTLSGNAAANGGGLLNAATLTLTASTLSANSASQRGGGIDNPGTAMLTNDTLSGNTTPQQGGALYTSGWLSLWNVTVGDNGASNGGGGALYMLGGATTVLTNTILAYSRSGGNCLGMVSVAKFTLDSDNTCGISGVNGNLYADPLLTALGNYGGPTLVHMPKIGSPAINAIAGNDAPGTDQRGDDRPVGAYDIGAVERQQPGDSDLAPREFLPLLRR